MELILWRHAEAEDGAPDEGRKLTRKGKRQARRVAKWLERRMPEDARVISSPARRAQQTARALRAGFESSRTVGLDVDARSVLEAAGWPGDDERTVVIVGHQPVLGQAAALALTGTPAAWSMKKGALIWLTSRKGGATIQAALRAAISPDFI